MACAHRLGGRADSGDRVGGDCAPPGRHGSRADPTGAGSERWRSDRIRLPHPSRGRPAQPRNHRRAGQPQLRRLRRELVVQEGTCKLYELYDAHRKGAGWAAASGAVFNLRSDALRPEGWTSADAAGLPIFPLLARYPEVATGQIDHALRVTVPETQDGYIHPATHYASSSSDPNLPPMGLRLRLKASYSLADFTGESLVILEALERYGLIVADNGSPWFITGAPNPHWNDENLEQIKRVPGSEFEAVETGAILR